jgi:peptidoglycan hydrolase-like protein with peptidoglycan-binding domain
MAQPEWQLGRTSAHYEGHGPGTISSGKGDYGGVSYGTYQFSTEPNGGSLKGFLRDSAYRDQFKGLEPKTPEFNAKWKELAKSDPGFAQDQHNVMKKTHYDPMVATLKAEGIDLSKRGPAVQDALWSTSVQFGPNHWHGAGGPDVFEKGMQEKFGKGYDLSKLSDADIVGAVQDYKIEHNKTLFKSSPTQWDSLENRARHEKGDLLKLAGEKVAIQGGDTVQPNRTPVRASGILKQDARGTAVHELQANLAKLGYTDGDGKPLKADGDFGLDTRHAVERFQHDHHLKVDGIAGLKTLEALDHVQAKNVTPNLADLKNPDHALYEQALVGVHKLDANLGRKPDQQSDQLAASLVVAAKRDGMTKIDNVVLSEDSSRVFAVQGKLDSPLRKIAHVQTAEAVNTPIAQSGHALAQLEPAPATQVLPSSITAPLAPSAPHRALVMQADTV